MVRMKGCLYRSLLLLQLCSTHAIVYVSENVCMHAFVNVCFGGGGDKTVLHQSVSPKMLLYLSNMRNRHTESLIQTNGGTLMWEDVTTDLY